MYAYQFPEQRGCAIRLPMTPLRIRPSTLWGAVCLSIVALLFEVGVSRAKWWFLVEDRPSIGPHIAASAGGAVVVAELFTSEGCSSCPPADEVLSRLVRGSLEGTVVLGLSEHVDYWDRLGWRDPFSSPAFSTRQSEYQSRVFRTGSVYTPQLVIDGQFEAIGSDLDAVRRAIASAAAIPKATVGMAVWRADAEHLSVEVRVNVGSDIRVAEPLDMVVAVTQDHLTSDVRRGENRGRSLTHTSVVRSLTALGSITPPGRGFETTATVPMAPEWNLGNIGIIGLLQERRSRRIVGAGSARVSRRESSPSGG